MKRPPGWAWFLAAFVGIVMANAIVPEAHGGTLSTSMSSDSSVLVALFGLAIGIGAIIAALLSIARDAPMDPNEPDPLQQVAEARTAGAQIVRLADHRGGPGQPDDKRSR